PCSTSVAVGLLCMSVRLATAEGKLILPSVGIVPPALHALPVAGVWGIGEGNTRGYGPPWLPPRLAFPLGLPLSDRSAMAASATRPGAARSPGLLTCTVRQRCSARSADIGPKSYRHGTKVLL